MSNRITPHKIVDTNSNESSAVSQTLLTSKNFPYPSCWQNEERVKVLLAPFRSREINPENYDSKMRFWRDVIAQYCVYKGEAKFNKRELQLVFSYEQRIPYCLDTVFAEMQHKKKIQTLEMYEYDPLYGWKAWAVNCFVKRPISWGFDKVKQTIGLENDHSSVDYVHLEIIQEFCKLLQKQVLEQMQGKLMHYTALKEIVVESINITDECLQLCLRTLHCQRKIGLHFKEQQIHLIKIPLKTDGNIQITENDHAVHNLQMTQQSLLKQLEVLEAEITSNENKARQYVLDKSRTIAKTYLRKNRMLEVTYKKRSLALHNIEQLLNSVNEAQCNGEVLDAYKIGSKALQNALEESGLQYDNVDEVIADVRETLDTHNEVRDLIGNANISPSSSTTDNDQLEKELQELLNDNKPSEHNNNINKSAQTKADEELCEELNNMQIKNKTPTPSLVAD